MNLFIGLILMSLGIVFLAMIFDKLTYDPKKAPSCWQPKIILEEK